MLNAFLDFLVCYRGFLYEVVFVIALIILIVIRIRKKLTIGKPLLCWLIATVVFFSSVTIFDYYKMQKREPYPINDSAVLAWKNFLEENDEWVKEHYRKISTSAVILVCKSAEEAEMTLDLQRDKYEVKEYSQNCQVGCSNLIYDAAWVLLPIEPSYYEVWISLRYEDIIVTFHDYKTRKSQIDANSIMLENLQIYQKALKSKQ